MVSRRNYTGEKVQAARSVLIELIHVLGEYRNEIVLIGGWVPELLLPNREKPHVGSMDVDLALNHKTLSSERYKTIQELLLSRGYIQGKQPFIFHRKVKVGDEQIDVQVDLLAGEYEGTGKSHRHQKIQGVFARKARGCDLAFEQPIQLIIEGTLPDGGEDSVVVRVASIVPFLVMKGMALDDRLKEKDAWDIYYCLINYHDGLDALVEQFKRYHHKKLIKEGLEKIARNFASINHIGPKSVADFEEVSDPEERELLQRDAFERVSYLLEKL